jgi:hypothetical protein
MGGRRRRGRNKKKIKKERRILSLFYALCLSNKRKEPIKRKEGELNREA